jgi:hypothetical protein
MTTQILTWTTNSLFVVTLTQQKSRFITKGTKSNYSDYSLNYKAEIWGRPQENLKNKLTISIAQTRYINLRKITTSLNRNSSIIQYL